MLEEQKEHAEFLKTAYAEYLNICMTDDFKHGLSLLDFNFDFINSDDFKGFIGMALRNSLIEITNLMNEWIILIHRWDAWNQVLNSYKSDSELEYYLEDEFSNLIIDKCLFAPSRMKDVFINEGIQVFHQVRLVSDNSYKDKIEGYDPKPNKNPPIQRSLKEKALKKVLLFCEGTSLINKIKALSSENYHKVQTKNYRNLSSHAFAPRITLGIASPFPRYVTKKTEFIEKPDGSLHEVEIENQTMVSYGIGAGIQPLDREELFEANLTELLKAIDCYDEFKSLLRQTISQIPNRIMN